MFGSLVFKSIKDEIIDAVLINNYTKGFKLINLCYNNEISHKTICSWLSPFKITVDENGRITNE